MKHKSNENPPRTPVQARPSQRRRVSSSRDEAVLIARFVQACADFDRDVRFNPQHRWWTRSGGRQPCVSFEYKNKRYPAAELLRMADIPHGQPIHRNGFLKRHVRIMPRSWPEWSRDQLVLGLHTFQQRRDGIGQREAEAICDHLREATAARRGRNVAMPLMNAYQLLDIVEGFRLLAIKAMTGMLPLKGSLQREVWRELGARQTDCEAAVDAMLGVPSVTEILAAGAAVEGDERREPSGRQNVKARDAYEAEVLHGDIVYALKRCLRRRGAKIVKKYEDVVAHWRQWIDVFEVKTSIALCELDRGGFQMLRYALQLEAAHPGFPVHRILVLPDMPSRAMRETFRMFGISIWLYRRKGRAFAFDEVLVAPHSPLFVERQADTHQRSRCTVAR